MNEPMNELEARQDIPDVPEDFIKALMYNLALSDYLKTLDAYNEWLYGRPVTPQ